MADYQRIVDEIQGYLASSRQASPAEIAPLAGEFARCCKEMNDRLRECHGYLRRGLRSEAIHLAEKHPVLLDVLAVLDFAELSEWKLACVSLDLPTPPPLAVQAAQALNDAYAEEVPLQSMLTAHRTLNLAQGALPARVKLLRKIAAADSATIHWGDDLEVVERLRLAEIEEQAREAEKRDELGWLEGLVQEVHEPGWRVPIPVEFKNELDAALKRLTNKTGEKMLRELVPKLEVAHSAMNFEECSAVLRQWDHIVKVCPHKLPADLLEQAAGARSWVTQEQHKADSSKAFDEACADLQGGLDRDVPTVELERLFQATTRYPYELAPELEQRYQKRLAERSAAAQRRFKMTMAGIAAAVIVVLGLSGFWFLKATYQSNLKRWIVAAKDAEVALETSGDLQRAISVRGSIAKEGARYTSNPDLEAETARLDAGIQKEKTRESEFKAVWANLQGADAVDELALKRAQILALRPDEKGALQALQDKLAQANANKQRQADQQFMGAAEVLRTRMDKQITAELLRLDHEGYIREVAACEALLKDLENRPDVTVSTRLSISMTLDAVLNQAKAALSAADAEQLKIETVAAAKSSKQNQTAIKDYLLSMPNGLKRDSFTAAQQRAEGDAAIEAWDSISASWSQSFVPKSEKEAADRIKVLEKYLPEHPKSPLLLAVGTYRDFLRRGMDAVAEDGVWKRTLDRLMQGALYTRLYVVETEQGKVYYTPEIPELTHSIVGDSITAYLYPDPDPNSAVKPIRRDLRKGDKPKILPTQAAPKSPQMIAAAAVRASIKKMTFDQWPFIGIDAVEIFRAQEKCDPVLQASTVLRISQLNLETLDWVEIPALKSAVKDLADLKPQDKRWIDPEDPESPSARAEISSAVRALPSAAELKQTINARTRPSLPSGFLGRGCYIGMPNKTATIVTLVKPEDGLVAFAVSAHLPKTVEEPGLVVVGHTSNGKWELENPFPEDIPEGTFLFIASANMK